MDKHKLARLLAVVSIAFLGAIAITTVPFLFAEENLEWLEIAANIKLLLLFLSIGLIIGLFSYVILRLFRKSIH